MDKSKRSTLKVVLYTVGVIVVLAIVISGIGAYSLFRSYKGFEAGEKSQIISTVDHFINLLNQNQIQDAYDLFSADAKKQIPLDHFKTATQDIKAVSFGYVGEDENFTSVRVKTMLAGDMSVNYTTVANFSDSTKGTINATVIKENGAWKIYYIDVIATPPHLNSR